MEAIKPGLLLVLGCQRSGTSLLAAMLGRHPEINMLYESTTTDVRKAIGKRYSGNKLLTWRQIRKTRRGSKFGDLLNRMANLDVSRRTKHHKIRVFPTSRMSIDDYLRLDASIIVITRPEEEVVRSITRRTGMSTRQAVREFQRSERELHTVADVALKITFSDLVNEPESVLQRICGFLDLDYDPRMLEGPAYNYVYPHSGILTAKDGTRSQE